MLFKINLIILLIILSSCAQLPTVYHTPNTKLNLNEGLVILCDEDPDDIASLLKNKFLDKGFPVETYQTGEYRYILNISYNIASRSTPPAFTFFNGTITDASTGNEVSTVHYKSTLVHGLYNHQVVNTVVNLISSKSYRPPNSIEYSIPPSPVIQTNNTANQITPPDNPTIIAVVDFTGNSVSDDDCRALTDRLRQELFNTKHYKVIEREMMEEIIKEQGFQQSGCSTDECMVEVGKLIGVEKIVGGSISKVGRTYSVSSRIVSVETGKILKGATYDYKGEIDELLTTGMRMVAYELIK